VCDGAILRARLDSDHPETTIQPFSWGYRNGYAIRFAPHHHALKGRLLVGEDGADDVAPGPPTMSRTTCKSPTRTRTAARTTMVGPTNSASCRPITRLQPDRRARRRSLRTGPNQPASMCTPASLQQILSEDVPIRNVLASPPQPITSPLAIEAADSPSQGLNSPPTRSSAIRSSPARLLYALEGDFGFSAANATSPAPESGHEVKLINFSQPGERWRCRSRASRTTPPLNRRLSTASALQPADADKDRSGQLHVGGRLRCVRDFGQSSPEIKFVGAGKRSARSDPGTGSFGVLSEMTRT